MPCSPGTSASCCQAMLRKRWWVAAPLHDGPSGVRGGATRQSGNGTEGRLENLSADVATWLNCCQLPYQSVLPFTYRTSTSPLRMQWMFGLAPLLPWASTTCEQAAAVLPANMLGLRGGHVVLKGRSDL